MDFSSIGGVQIHRATAGAYSHISGLSGSYKLLLDEPLTLLWVCVAVPLSVGNANGKATDTGTVSSSRLDSDAAVELAAEAANERAAAVGVVGAVDMMARSRQAKSMDPKSRAVAVSFLSIRMLLQSNSFDLAYGVAELAGLHLRAPTFLFVLHLIFS